MIGIEGDEFDGYIKDNRAVLVDFWAPWCMPCQMQGRMLEASMNGLPEGVKAIKVNVDDNPHLAQRYGVRGIPQLFLFLDGKVAHGWTGLTRPEALFSKIRELV